MSTLSTIATLKEIRRRCSSDEPLTDDQALWLSDCLGRFLGHNCESMEDAFDLRFARGGVPWWREEAIRARNAALLELGARFFSDLTPHAKAQRVWELSGRYGASSWRHDRDRDEMPPQYEGTPKEYLWLAFKSGATMPIGTRQLRNILY